MTSQTATASEAVPNPNRTRVLAWLLLPVGLVALAFGARSVLRPPPSQPAAAPVAATATDETQALASADPPAAVRCAPGVIDSFETEDDGKLAQCEGRFGSWYTFNDGQPGTLQFPAPGRQVSLVVPGLERQGYALRTRGKCQLGAESSTVWGAGLGFDLSNPEGRAETKRAYDAPSRGFVGLRFKARIGEETGATNIVTIRVPDINTDPSGGKCQTCYDDYKASIKITREWQDYRVPFTQLKRDGNGVPNLPLATDALVSVQFRFSAGDTFDLYVDDVAFISASEVGQATPRD